MSPEGRTTKLVVLVDEREDWYGAEVKDGDLRDASKHAVDGLGALQSFFVSLFQLPNLPR